MRRTITQRELRNESGRIMRALDRGRSFLITRNGVPVGELMPVRDRTFVAAEAVRVVLAGAARVNARRFRRDLDRMVDQDVHPRG